MSIPLVYTQVVTLATYSYLVACIVGRQYIDISTEPQQPITVFPLDAYFPLWTLLENLFYMGLLKVYILFAKNQLKTRLFLLAII